MAHIQSSYTLIDEQPLSGDNYYRLKQVDLNGKSTIEGQIIHVFTNDKLTVSVFPNPADKVISFSWTNLQKGEIPSIDIRSVDGRKISTTDIIKMSDTTYQLSTENMIEGLYFLTVGSNQWTTGEVIKIQIVH